MGIKHSTFSWLLMILAVNENMHKSLDEFEFGQDLKTDYERLKINVFSVAFNQVHFRFVDNKDMHNI